MVLVPGRGGNSRDEVRSKRRGHFQAGRLWLRLQRERHQRQHDGRPAAAAASSGQSVQEGDNDQQPVQSEQRLNASFMCYWMTSVTRWLQYFLLFWLLTTIRICTKFVYILPKWIEIFVKHYICPQKVCLRFFKVCPSVEITLNLVTLVGSKVPIPAGDSLHVKDFTAETKIIIARRFRDIRLTYATKVVLMVDHSSRRNGLAFSNWQTNHRYTKLTYLGRLCSPVSI